MRHVLAFWTGLCLASVCLVACGGGGGGGGAVPVAPPAGSGLRIQTSALPNGALGQAFNVTIRAVGGTGVGNAWRIATGTLPPGLGMVGGPACLDWGTFQQVGTIYADEATGERTEISGLAASRLNPGVLWAHDDSGGAAILHALSAQDGHLLQRYVLDASVRDWEDIAMGPGADADHEAILIGDIGDNLAIRDHVTLFQVEEPLVPTTPSDPIALSHQTFTFVYPEGPRDAEALIVDWTTGAPYIIEKSDVGADAYRVPLPLDVAWTIASPGTLVRVTTGRPLPATLTAADAARDGRRVVLRSYSRGYELVAAPGAGLESAFVAEPCTFSVPSFGQYESLALSPGGLFLSTTTELVLSSVPLQRASAARDDLPARIVGTPTRTGTWPLTIEVRDASGATATRMFDLVVR